MLNIEIQNYIFILASNGFYGKEIALSLYNRCSVIITDIQMPILNGIDMIKLLLENNIKTKIFINSACDKTDPTMNELLLCNNISYLEKGANTQFNKILCL